ncbi:fimbrial protein [Lelliottia sp. CFBP8978]|uniref:fimbrial protein n=1 Tax=Lelliottia sp. CFBP8978 TaxID=3096522 RepID=UPI002A6A69EC|nr:fimbrial protein [Lelliottia sp. CFBP8978]MDY1035415.1 fimbrial protein [Lelliottia sp. CFBP8978]
MNKKILAMSMAMAFSGVVGMSYAEQPAPQDVTITAQVVNELSCVVDAPSSVSFDNVEMREIGTLENQYTLKNNAVTIYDVKLTECPADQTVSLTVLGTPAAGNDQLLAIDAGAGSAQGVGVAIWDVVLLTDEKFVLAPNGSGHASMSHDVDSDGSVRIPLTIGPVKISDATPIVAGAITTSTSIKVNFL